MKIPPNRTPVSPLDLSQSANKAHARATPTKTLPATEGTRENPISTNFASMSRDQLYAWINDRIKSGELSVADSSGLLGLTGRGTVDGRSIADNGREVVNFFQIADQGISAARQRQDEASARFLQSTIDVMRRFQSRDAGRMV